MPTATDLVPDSGSEHRSVHVTVRAAAAFCLLSTGVSLAMRLWSSDHWAAVAIALAGAAFTVTVVPGALATLAWRPSTRVTLFEVVGFGAAISLGLVHLLTVFAITAHVEAVYVAAALITAVVAAGGWVGTRRNGAVIEVPLSEGVIAALLGVMAAFLYIQGSPIESFEDQMHVAISQRLAATTPAIDTFFFVPDVIYTYPFPATHYLIALVSVVSGVDVLFVFHKLRALWGPFAIVMLFLAARAVFASRAVASTVGLTAIALVFSGVYAVIPGTFWAQLVPFSHASDVAASVFLPALLAAAFTYMQADTPRNRGFLLTAIVLLMLLITTAHVREMIQFGSYLACFVAGSVILRTHRTEAIRAARLLAMSVAFVILYYLWHRAVVLQVTTVVAAQRERLGALFRDMPLTDLLFRTAPEVLSDLFYGFEATFHGLTPIILFAAPIVVIAFRTRPLVWLLAWSTLAYLVAITIPLVALAYAYATYYELFFSAARNFTFFLYLIAGAFVYVVIAAVGSLRRLRVGGIVGAGAALGILALLAGLSLGRDLRGLFAPLIAAHVLAYVYALRVSRRGGLTRRAMISASLVAAVAVGALAMGHRSYAAPPPLVNVRWSDAVDDRQRAELERRFSLVPVELSNPAANVWTYGARDVTGANIEALVTHPHTADTHHIDRDRFTVEYERPRSQDPVLGSEYIDSLRYPGPPLSIAAAVAMGILGFFIPLAMTSAPRLAEWLGRVDHDFLFRPAVFFGAWLAFIVPFALWTARPALSPLSMTAMPPAGHASTPRALLEQMPCRTRDRMEMPFSGEITDTEPLTLANVTSCPPSYELVQWVRTNIEPDAVFAINRWNHYLPTVFLPQQVVAFPGFERAYADEMLLFRPYYEFYARSIRTRGMQPFFNSAETAAERRAFVQALGVTHVLVDPAYHDEMRRVLDSLPRDFRRVFTDDEDRWVVYEVTGAGASGSTTRFQIPGATPTQEM